MKSAYITKTKSVYEMPLVSGSHLRGGKEYIRIFAFLMLAIWCFGFTGASLFPKSFVIILYPLLKQFYSNVCHQIAYKSFEMNGINFLVCARCSGIYFGGFLSTILLLFTSKRYSLNVNIILLAAVPMAIDVILYSSGVYAYSKIIALATGLLFGFVTISFVLLSVENLFIKENNRDQ